MISVKKKAKDDTTGFEKFNRVTKKTNIVLNVIFALFALACVIPFIYVIAISFSTEETILEFGYRLLPGEVTIEGYRYLLAEGNIIIRAMAVSLFVTIVGTVIGLILTTTMGYGLSRPDYRLHGFMTMLIFIPMVFGGGLVSTYVINSQVLHLKDTMWVLILPMAVSSFNVIICRTFFQSTVADSLIDSAKIDGANQLVIYSRIVMPISLPLSATIGLFLSFGYWNDWFLSMLYIENRKLLPLQGLLNSILTNIDMLKQSMESGDAYAAELMTKVPTEATRMAIVVLIIVPIICAYPFLQRYFVSGLTVGSVKG